MKPRRFLVPILLAVALAVAGLASAADGARPNLVLILADDLGYGDLGCYGAPDLRTPHIDRLARDGVTCTVFRANSCVCSPTRAALLTGCYPDRVGVPGVIRTHPANSWGRLAPEAVLLPRPLRAAGYHTALVGKWHLGLTSPDTPPERGFGFFHGFLGDMMDDYLTHRRHGDNLMRRNTEVIDPPGHATDLFTDWACAYLRERAAAGTPFFLYLAYNAPHTPIQPPAGWTERVQQRQPGMTPQRAKLVALIEHLDAGVGRVLDTLRSTGLEERTLVLFTSDNGGDLPPGANNGPVRAGKGTMYEGGLRVPFLARWPGQIPPGSRSDWPAVTMDLYPTLLEAAGARAEQPVDGVSILATLRSQPQPRVQRDLFFTRREGGRAYFGKTIDAVIRGDWKLLQNTPTGPLELYNLRDDPREERDLAAREKQRVAELATALQAHLQRAGAVPWQAPPKQ